MIELEFDQGRAVVNLGDGRSLSILNPDRTAYINRVDPLLELMGNMLGTTAATRADDLTYEVAVIDTETEEPIKGLPDPSWAHYLDPMVTTDRWDIFANVPLSLIEDLVEAHQR